MVTVYQQPNFVSAGFQRPIQVFTKSAPGSSVHTMTPLMHDLAHSSTSTPHTNVESSNWPTPAFGCGSSCTTTPNFELGSCGGFTPCSSVTCSSATGTPTYQAWSASATPHNDSDSTTQCTSELCGGYADSASNTPQHRFGFSMESEAGEADCSPAHSDTHTCEGDAHESPGENRADEHGTDDNDHREDAHESPGENRADEHGTDDNDHREDAHESPGENRADGHGTDDNDHREDAYAD